MTDNLHYRACNLCEAICGLVITVQDGEVLSVKGDPDDPLSKGHICPKAVALKDVYADPDRLRTPVRRTANGWEAISWEEAFEAVATGLQRVQETHGKDAVGVYLGNPTVHNWGSMLLGPEFFRLLQTKNRFSATSADQLPHHLAALLMYGHYLSIPVPDVDHTDFMLILGANPLVSNGSLMTAPGMDRRLKAIRQRGGKVVVIDPRYTETAKAADVHWYIKPGEDAFLLLAMVHTLFDEDLLNLSALEPLVKNITVLQTAVQGYAPETVAARLGISAGDIRQLTRDFAEAPSAVCYGRMGLSTQAFGGLCQWLIQVLNILTGNLDRRGGSMFALPAFDLVGQQIAKGKHGSFGRWHSRVQQLPEFGGELPVAALATEILTPGKGQIRALVTAAGNPVLSIPNGQLLDEGLQQLDFMVSIDIYINETTRHADIILPPTTGLETDHYDMIFHVFGVRNTARYSPALFDRQPEQRHDWEIFLELANRMGRTPGLAMRPDQLLAYALPLGPYAKDGLTLEVLKSHPHGIDLGPLQPCLPDRLFTADKKIDLIPTPFAADLSRLNDLLQQPDPGMLLIGRRQLRSNNSWMHNSYRLVKGRARCTLMIHPEDAARLHIAEGQEVQVESAAGSVALPAELTTGIMPGVVSIPHGWGHRSTGMRLSVAEKHPGVSANDLTDYRQVDKLSGNAVFSGVPVSLRPLSL
jgi:anaerobic selenocysteine-containing dehydrogenase